MKLEHHTILKSTSLDTPLGPMIAIADEHALYLLEFVDRPKLAREIERLKTKSTIIPGTTLPIHSIEKELHYYFDGNLKEFKTPLCLIGTPFQQSVWNELKKIPLGQTVSYADIAIRIGNPKAVRAVANANGANQLALIVPCHRVIHTNGELGGYAGGVTRKKWLLHHEQIHKRGII